MPEEKLIQLTDDNFIETVKSAGKPVLVDFYADWCGPCKMAAPIIEKLAEEYKDKIVVGKVDIDQNQATTAEYGVMSIPTVIVFKAEDDEIKIISSQTGFAGESTYKDMIDQAIK
jgi:thioredoxin 1